MPATDQRIVVEGLRELNAAFARAEGTIHKDFRGALRDAAEPVRSTAESLAETGIRNIGIPWSRMRVGVTRSSVYVAPRKRGARRGSQRRPNLAGLLLERAMQPALEREIPNVQRKVEQVLDDMARTWSRGG